MGVRGEMKKKKYIVMPRNTRVMKDGLDTGKGHLDFKGKSMMYLNDSALADEIETNQGLKGDRDVWVHEDPRLEHQINYHADGISKSFFGPTRAFAEGWERVFGKR